MALNTFKQNSPDTLRWHWELGEGELLKEFFEYLWFDGIFTGDDGDYYLRVGPATSQPTGCFGIDHGGIPTYGFDLVLPNGKVYDHTQIYKPEEFKEAEFGGYWGDNALLAGKMNEKGEVTEYQVKFDINGVSCDLTCIPETKWGCQFVHADHGYSYFHPKKNRAMGWWPLIPRADVTGTVTFDGKTVNLKGSAYLDKQVSNKEETFGGSGQAWWTWGHFWAGPYTASFTDSAPTAHYKYRHFSPLVMWKNGEMNFASFDFVNYIEEYGIDEVTDKFYPRVMSMRAIDGSTEVYAQITNGIITEVAVTQLDYMKYVRQIADIDLQVYHHGELVDQQKGKILVEYGAGAHYMPWDKIDAK